VCVVTVVVVEAVVVGVGCRCRLIESVGGGGGCTSSEGLWPERALCMVYCGMVVSGGDGVAVEVLEMKVYLVIKVSLFCVIWAVFYF